MNDHDSAALRGAVEEAIALLRGHVPRIREALSPIIDSLEALCASLQRSVAEARPDDGHAAVLVVSRDLIATALVQLGRVAEVDTRATTLALATVHNRVVAALDACTVGAKA